MMNTINYCHCGFYHRKKGPYSHRIILYIFSTQNLQRPPTNRIFQPLQIHLFPVLRDFGSVFWFEKPILFLYKSIWLFGPPRCRPLGVYPGAGPAELHRVGAAQRWAALPAAGRAAGPRAKRGLEEPGDAGADGPVGGLMYGLIDGEMVGRIGRMIMGLPVYHDF